MADLLALLGPVLVYIAISLVNLALAKSANIEGWIATRPRLAAVSQALEVIGFDWRKLAEVARAKLEAKRQSDKRLEDYLDKLWASAPRYDHVVKNFTRADDEAGKQ